MTPRIAIIACLVGWAQIAQAVSPSDSDPSSVYDEKGPNGKRGFNNLVPEEHIDPFTGSLALTHTDLELPGVAGLDLVLRRIYNSKIHHNYAWKNTDKAATGLQFVPPSPVGLGWSMHLGRLINAMAGTNALVSSTLGGPRYYESPDGAQHPFFQACADITDARCHISKDGYGLFKPADGKWRVSSPEGRVITFDHQTSGLSGLTFMIYRYATEIRDIFDNTIQIFYEDDNIDTYMKHFIDYIVDSAGRTIQFSYADVGGTERLTSITLGARTISYQYVGAGLNPWEPYHTFLEDVVLPEGMMWSYDYGGLLDNTCTQDRFCELTKITYPTGGIVEFTYDDRSGANSFYIGTNIIAARVVRYRKQTDRAASAYDQWEYQYNRGASYSGTDHTVIIRPDGSKEASTFFGVSSGTYDPIGNAWKAGVVVRKEIRTSNNTVLQTEEFDWQPSWQSGDTNHAPISTEDWGDPWIGFDLDVVAPMLKQHKTTRGTLVWTTNNTTFNHWNRTPRCTEEIADDGSKRYHLRAYQYVESGDHAFRFTQLLANHLLRTNAFTTANCDDTASSSFTYTVNDDTMGYTYDTDGTVQRRNENGIVSDYFYNNDGTLKAEVLYQGNDGSPTNGFCTAYDYETATGKKGLPKTTKFGAPHSSNGSCGTPLYQVERTYNADGTMASRDNGRGDVTSYQYDDLGRLERIDYPAASGESDTTIDYTNENSFYAIKQVNQGAAWSRVKVDGFGRKILESSSDNRNSHWRYNALGQIVLKSLPTTTANGSSLNANDGESYTYDELGRLKVMTAPNGDTTTYTYGSSAHTVSKVTTVSLGSTRTTVETYRAYGNPEQGLLVRIRMPGESAPSEDSFEYLVGGHLLLVRYQGQQRRLYYNQPKKIIQESTPESGTVYWGYDAAGNLRCRSIGYAYCNDTAYSSSFADVRYDVDGLGRTTAVKYSVPAVYPNVTYTYKGASNLDVVTDHVGTHTYTYSATDRVKKVSSVIKGATYVTDYEYDANGFLRRIKYPSGRLIDYGNDGQNRIGSVSDATPGQLATYVSSVQYHVNGQMRQLSHANGVTSTLSYDSYSRPQRLQTFKAASGILDLTHAYDGRGNLRTLTNSIDATQSASFTYDLLDRLETANGSWGALNYTYRGNGDRDYVTHDGKTTTYNYSGAQLTELSTANGGLAQTLTYANTSYPGRLSGLSAAEGAYGYSYDPEQRLDRVTFVASGQYGTQEVAKLTYTATGRIGLTSADGCAGKLVYHYDQEGNRIAESTEGGVFTNETVFANGRALVELDVTPFVYGPTGLDFGDVEVLSKAVKKVTLTNRSDKAISIAQADLSVPYSFAAEATFPLVIPALSSVDLNIAFTPTARGAVSGTIAACKANGVWMSVKVTGKGIAAIAKFEPATIAIGNIPYGDEATDTVTLSNIGDAPLVVSGWVLHSTAETVDPDSAFTLNPGQSVAIDATFYSSETCGGTYASYVTLDSNSVPDAFFSLTANVLLFDVSDNELAFPPLTPGTSDSQAITLTSRATVPVPVQVGLSGTDRFALNGVPTVLNPGQSAAFNVDYAASAFPWSPFGDHATIEIGKQNCTARCDDRIHIAGNRNVQEIDPAEDDGAVFGDDRSGTYHSLAEVNGSLHVVTSTKTPNYSFFGTTYSSEMLYLVRDNNGTWQYSEPLNSAVASDFLEPTIVSGPSRSVTIMGDRNDNAVLFKQFSSGAWGETCTLPTARRVGRAAIAEDDTGALYFAGASPQTAGLFIHKIFEANGTCTSTDAAIGSVANTSAASDLDYDAGRGQFVFANVVGAGYFSTATGVGNYSSEGDSDSFGQPALFVDEAGNWHVVWERIRYGLTYIPRLRYLTKSAASAQLGATIEPFPPSYDAASSRVLMDAMGTVHIAWTDHYCHEGNNTVLGSSRIHYATRSPNATTWRVSESSPTLSLSYGASIDFLRSGDKLHAVWKELGATAADNKLYVGETTVSCPPGGCNGPCDDSNPCTHSDRLTLGVCAGTAYSCDDGNACTEDTCSGDGNCTSAERSGACDDGSACSFDDTCVAGVCTGTGYACDDTNVCTDDTCLGDGDCSFTNNAATCDDGDGCTTADTCVEGSCAGAPLVCEAPECQQDYACNPTSGACEGSVAADGTPCGEIGGLCVSGVCVEELPPDEATDDGDDESPPEAGDATATGQGPPKRKRKKGAFNCNGAGETAEAALLLMLLGCWRSARRSPR